MQAMMLMGQLQGIQINSTVMIVVEGQKKLGDDAHRYYDSIIHQLEQDPAYPAHSGPLGIRSRRPAPRVPTPRAPT